METKLSVIKAHVINEQKYFIVGDKTEKMISTTVPKKIDWSTRQSKGTKGAIVLLFKKINFNSS